MEDIGITSLSEVRSREEVNWEGREGEKRQKIEEEHEGGGGSGGLLDNLLAKLSSPRATASDHPIDGRDFEAADADHVHGSTNGVSEGGIESGVKGADDDGGGGGGGVINNIISSIFHRGGDEGENEKNGGDQGKIENKVDASEVGDKDLAKDNGGTENNGGGIISNLVPDDAAPASDEASILIHSIVHD